MKSLMKKLMYSFTILLVFIVEFSPNLLAASGGWEKVNFSGGEILNMKSFPGNPEIMLCCLIKGGLYKSENRGRTWTQLRNEPTYDIAISEENIAYAATQEGLFLSKDYGNQWSRIIDHATWQVICHDSGIVVADTMTQTRPSNNNPPYDPWLISFDYGSTWKSWEGTGSEYGFITSLNETKRGDILFYKDGTVIRTEHTDVYRSDPNDWNVWTYLPARSWMEAPFLYFIHTPTKDSILYGYSKYYDFHPMGFIPGGLFKSTDLGQTWSSRWSYTSSITAAIAKDSFFFVGEENGRVSLLNSLNNDFTTLGKLGGAITALEAERWAAGELIVSTKGGIFKTTDKGLNWYKSDDGILHPHLTAVQIIPMDQTRERIIVSEKYSGIWISDDDGVNWKSTGLEVYTIPGLLKKAPSNPKVIYSGGALIYISLDGGEHWVASKNFPATYYGWYSRCVDIDVNPNDPKEIIASLYDHSMDDYRGLVLARGNYSENSGWSWFGFDWIFSKLYNPERSQFGNKSDLVWISQSRDWSPNKITLLSLDLKSYSKADTLYVPDSSFTDLWLIKDSTCLLFNQKNRRLWRSLNFGKSWTFYTFNFKYNQRRDDWHSLGPDGDLIFSPDDKHLFFMYPNYGIFNSKDSGETWQELNTGLETLSAYQMDFSFHNSSTAYVATNDGLYKNDLSIEVEIKEKTVGEVKNFALLQNYPNPFNPTTIIKYDIVKSGNVSLKIYDILGNEVATLVNEEKQPGSYEVEFQSVRLRRSNQQLASGIYFYQLRAGEFVQTKKMILLK